MRNILSVFIIAFLISSLCSCGDNPSGKSGEDTRIVAKINNYNLTVSDFEDETKFGSSGRNKEELLDRLITKKILLREAQKQNFDKDRAFMEEIERYWEQALLKLLLKKKMAELSRSIAVDEGLPPEARNDIRQKKIQEALDKWVNDLKDRSDIKIYKENLEKVR